MLGKKYRGLELLGLPLLTIVLEVAVTVLEVEERLHALLCLFGLLLQSFSHQEIIGQDELGDFSQQLAGFSILRPPQYGVVFGLSEITEKFELPESRIETGIVGEEFVVVVVETVELFLIIAVVNLKLIKEFYHLHLPVIVAFLLGHFKHFGNGTRHSQIVVGLDMIGGNGGNAVDEQHDFAHMRSFHHDADFATVRILRLKAFLVVFIDVRLSFRILCDEPLVSRKHVEIVIERCNTEKVGMQAWEPLGMQSGNLDDVATLQHFETRGLARNEYGNAIL